MTIDQPVSERPGAAAERCPVADWATDYDLFDEQFVVDPYSVWETCAVAAPSPTPTAGAVVDADPLRGHRRRRGGHEHFSSATSASPAASRARARMLPPRPSPPTRPTHRPAAILLPAFSPKPSSALTPLTRAIADELIEELLPRCGPGRRPRRRRRRLRPAHPGAGDRRHAGRTRDRRGPVHRLGHAGPAGRPERPRGRRRAAPVRCSTTSGSRWRSARRPPGRRRGPDLPTCSRPSSTARRSNEKHILGTCFLLLVAGIDTTWSSIGSRCGTSPPTPRTVSGWWPSRS